MNTSSLKKTVLVFVALSVAVLAQAKEFNVQAGFATYFDQAAPGKFLSIQDMAFATDGDVLIFGDTTPSLNEFPADRTSTLGTLSSRCWFLAKLSSDGTTLRWFRYLGYSGAPEAYTAGGIKVRPDGTIFLCGKTVDPLIPNAINALRGPSDGVVLKLNSDATQVLWAVYVGGSAKDSLTDLDIDASGNMYVSGQTLSPDLPQNLNAYHLWTDGFVAKLNPTGQVLYSRYIGGSSVLGSDLESVLRVRGDGSGQLYFVAQAYSPDVEVSPGAYDSTYNGSGMNLYLGKLNSSGGLSYGTYLGSDLFYTTYFDYGKDRPGFDIDAAGDVLVTGNTNSNSVPTVNADQGSYLGAAEGFLAKFNPGGQPIYITYVGGNGTEIVGGMSLDPNGYVYVSGIAENSAFITTPDALRPTTGDACDGFLRIYTPAGRLTYSSFIGGEGSCDTARKNILSPNGKLILDGYNADNVPSFPTTPGVFQPISPQPWSPFLISFNTSLLPPTVSFKDAGLTVSESPAVPNNAAVVIERNGDSRPDIGVTFKTFDDSALSGQDYGPATASLSWGSGNVSPKTIQIPIVNDNIAEPQERFGLRLENPIGATIENLNPIYVTINDDDLSREEIGFNGPLGDPSQYRVNENGGPVQITIYRTGVDMSHPFSVQYTFSNGTAVNGSDYTGISGVVTWNNSQFVNITIDVPIINDLISEPEKTFQIFLSNPSNGAVLNPTKSTATITIVDDDNSFRFNPNSILAGEGMGSAIMTVERTSDPSREARVIVRTQGGSAVANQDYVPLNQELTWAAGDTGAKQIFVPILDDPIAESTETITLVFIDPLTLLPFDPQIGTIQILDNDTPVPSSGQIQVTLLTSTTVAENVGQISFQVTRVGGKDGTLTLQYETVNVTAQSGFDYTQTSGLVPFPDQNTTPVTIVVPILDDSIPEPNKVFNLAFNWPDGPQAGQSQNIPITIRDDDGPVPAPTALATGLPSKNLINLSKNEQAEIRCDLTAPGPIDVTIYDRLGREVIHLNQDDGAAGPHVLFWNGRDAEGVIVSAGMYHAVIKADGKTKKLPIVVTK